MSYKTTYESLITQLQTVTSLPTLQKENNRIQLGGGKTPWCRASILPVPTNIATLGPNGLNNEIGIFQVDLFYPQDNGYDTSFDMADSILQKYKAGSLVDGIIIRNSWISSNQQINGQGIQNYYMISVRVEFNKYVSR